MVEQLGGKSLVAQDFGMHANHQNFFVIGAIEDADPSPLGEAYVGAPEEVMFQLVLAGLLEARNFASRWIDAGHDVGNRSVFARRIHTLEYQQQGIAAAGIVKPLQLAQLFLVLIEELLILLFGFEKRLYERGPLGQVYLFSARHTEVFAVNLHDFKRP
jgi:hypothetical protein